MFPRKPLLDRVIVREIPIAEYYEQPKEGDVGYVPLDGGEVGASAFKEKSDRGVVVAVSKEVESAGEVAVGNTVFFDEFAMSDPVYLNPAHKNRSDLPKYWQIRVEDLKGVDVSDVPPIGCGAEWNIGQDVFGCIRPRNHDGKCRGVRCGTQEQILHA